MWEACLLVPIGVLVAVKSKGGAAWCWRRLFRAGQKLGGTPEKVKLTSDQRGPGAKDPIVLVECRNPLFFESDWLPRDQWAEAGLHWHETCEPRSAPEKDSNRWGWTFSVRCDPKASQMLSTWQVARLIARQPESIPNE